MTGSGEGLARNTTTATITTTTTTTAAAAAAPAAVETGYVGNLTPDQEKKLQQLWRLLLAAFDFDGSRLYHHADEESTTLPPPSQESKGSVGGGGSQEEGKAAAAAAESSANEEEQEQGQEQKLREIWLSMTKQENPDALLLRFLRARKWDVAAALGMLRNALLWRCDDMRVDEEVLAKGEGWCAVREKEGLGSGEEEEEAELENLGGEGADDGSGEKERDVGKDKDKAKVKDKEKDKEKEKGKEEKEKEKQEEKKRKDAHDFLQQLRMGKVYIRGTDRRGRPVGYVKISLHKPGAQSEETLEKLIVHTIETARCLFATPSAPAESFCVVFDLTDFSLSNMEWQPVKFIIRAFEANYPECLGALLIHNAPWIFSGIWKIIRTLLDPVVAAKVDFTRNTAGLEKYIARENIISAYGGDDDWTYAYVEPSLDEDARIVLPPEDDSSSSFSAERKEKEKEKEKADIMAERHEIAERFLAATHAWIKHAETPGESEEAAIQAQLRSNAAEALWANYWKLDPCVRSRTVLDRTGVIKPGGEVEMYPDRRRKEVDGEEEVKGKEEDNAAAAAVDERLQDLTIQDLPVPIPVKKKRSWGRQ